MLRGYGPNDLHMLTRVHEGHGGDGSSPLVLDASMDHHPPTAEFRKTHGARILHQRFFPDYMAGLYHTADNRQLLPATPHYNISSRTPSVDAHKFYTTGSGNIGTQQNEGLQADRLPQIRLYHMIEPRYKLSTCPILYYSSTPSPSVNLLQ